MNTDTRMAAPPRTAPTGGHGCADPDTLAPRPPLAQRVDLAAIDHYTAGVKRAREAYRECPSWFSRWPV